MIGQPVDRLDGKVKVTGAARYSAEYPYSDLAHAALVHATVSRGRITGVDTGAAREHPGVVAVLTHENAPKLVPTTRSNPLVMTSLAPGTTVNYLNTDEVYWDGQPVAVVVADTIEAATYGASLVEVTCELLPSAVDFAAAERDAKPQRSSPFLASGKRKGDAARALAAAPVTVDNEYRTPQQQHNAIEPHATTAVWDGDSLTVHESTQNIAFVRAHLAHKFAVPLRDIRVVCPFVGGAFGGKALVWPGTVLAVLAARVTGRPVRLTLTREGVNRTVGGRPQTSQRVALGAEPDGRLMTLIHTSTTRIGRTGGQGEQLVSMFSQMYDAANISTQQHEVALDMLPNTIMRAPGEATGSFGLESAMDELAYRLNVDPVELRVRTEPATRRTMREVYGLGAEKFGWGCRDPRPRSRREGRWLVGTGVAAAYHRAWQFGANVTVRLNADGTVLVRCGLHEMGMGAATAQAQVAAHALGLPVENVTVEWGDSTLPAAPGASGSGQTASVAAAVLAACRKINRTRRPGGTVEASVGSDTRWGELARNARTVRRVLDLKRHQTAARGVHFCEVRVDADTGEVRVSRWVGAFDVGTVINAKTAASQLRGGIVMGIGMALMEQTQVDPRTGRIMNPSLTGYHIPVHADVPPIDVQWLDVPDPTMPLGLLGVGEVGIVGAAAAVTNAIYHATGRRVRDLPVTPDKLL